MQNLKAIDNPVDKQSLCYVENSIIELIKFHYISNEYILSFSKVFNMAGVDQELIITMDTVLTSCYQIQEQKTVNRILTNSKPTVLSLNSAAHIVAAQIRELHLKNAPESNTVQILFTRKDMMELLRFASIVHFISSSFYKTTHFGTEQGAFEDVGNDNNLFNYSTIAEVILIVLGGTMHNEDQFKAIFDAISGINPRTKKDKLDIQLYNAIEELKKLILLTNKNLKREAA